MSHLRRFLAGAARRAEKRVSGRRTVQANTGGVLANSHGSRREAGNKVRA